MSLLSTAVFYCSVGRRASLLAERVSDDLIEQGTIDTYNLKYGIFGWHNEQKPLVDNSDMTVFVHPYSNGWSNLIEHKNLIRFTAE